MGPVVIGRIGRIHGLRGQVMLEACPLSADELLALRDITWRGPDGATAALVIRGARPIHGRMIVRFEDIADRLGKYSGAAEEFVGHFRGDGAAHGIST